MQLQPFSSVRRDDIERLLQYIPFFRQIQQQDSEQFQLLLAFSRVAVLEPKQVLLQAGSKDNWLYFLLRGELAVSVNSADAEPKVVNTIQSGDVFGEIALLLNTPRSADIRVADGCRQATVFGLDFNAFGRVQDFSLVTLATKLSFYRNVVHTLRWKLEVYRSQYPSHPLANAHRKLKVLAQNAVGNAALEDLHQQATDLARLLVQWNPSINKDPAVAV